MPGLPSMKYTHYPSSVPAGNHYVNRSSSGALAANEHTEAATSDPLIGRKVWTRWPEDNSFYEAVITDYNPAEVCIKKAYIIVICKAHLRMRHLVFKDSYIQKKILACACCAWHG